MQQFYYGKYLENTYLENREINGRITLRWIVGRQVVTVRGGWSRLRIGFGIFGAEPSGSVSIELVLFYFRLTPSTTNQSFVP
jgi:hypothetical protein